MEYEVQISQLDYRMGITRRIQVLGQCSSGKNRWRSLYAYCWWKGSTKTKTDPRGRHYTTAPRSPDTEASGRPGSGENDPAYSPGSHQCECQRILPTTCRVRNLWHFPIQFRASKDLV